MAHDHHDLVLSQLYGQNGLVDFDLIDLSELVIIPDDDFSVRVLTIAGASHECYDLIPEQELNDFDVT